MALNYRTKVKNLSLLTDLGKVMSRSTPYRSETPTTQAMAWVFSREPSHSRGYRRRLQVRSRYVFRENTTSSRYTMS